MEVRMDTNNEDNRSRERSPLRDRMKRERDDSRGSPDGRNRDRDRSRRGDRPSRFGPRSASHERGNNRKGSVSERRIFVSNVAYEYRWQELKDLFRNEVGEVAYVELFTDENDKPRGCGIVEFESADSVKKAVEKMHRYELKGRKLVVKEDCEREVEKYMRNKNIGGSGGAGGPGMMVVPRLRDDRGGNWGEAVPPVPLPSLTQAAAVVGTGPQSKWGNTYGLSPQFLESLWITGPLSCKVFVANLDYKVDEKKLREVFKLAGKVLHVELSVDKEGKSRGFGVVEYEHPVEAVQAISMLHNQTLFDRKLTVRMDRVDHKADDKLPEGLRGIGMGLGANGAPLRDVARNLPSLQQPTPGLVGGVGAAAAGGLGTGLGLGSTTNLATGLGGVGGLAGGSLIGGGNDLGLGSGIGGSNPFGGPNIGGAIGAAAGGLGSGLGTGGALGSGNLGGGNFGGMGGGGGFGNSSGMGGGYGGGGGRDFDSIGGGMGGGIGGSGMNDRSGDFRSSMGGGGFSNGPSRTGLGGMSNSGGGGGGRSDTIIIKNLPPLTTWRMLRDKFREIGEVKFAELRGSDVGLVRFNNEWDAERAVHMFDRSRMDGCTIDVNFY